MYNVSAHAIRYRGWIEVTVKGYLPTSCHQARIVDVYPGGNIVYIKDPGAAQVFIEETVLPGVVFCPLVMVPWAATVCIMDDFHDKVAVFVNRQKHVEVKVKEKSKAQFIVLQLTGGIIPNGPYSIVPARSLYPAIYTKVYGPASYAKCDEWVKQHSDFAILDGIALGYGLSKQVEEEEMDEKEELAAGGGGGGGNPHGLSLWLSGGGGGNPRGL